VGQGDKGGKIIGSVAGEREHKTFDMWRVNGGLRVGGRR
jgi:hypothetical protein